MSASSTFRDVLVPLLRCVTCPERSPVELRAAPPHADSPVPLADEALFCTSCGARYDVTSDHIPIMMRGGLGSFGVGDAAANLAANMDIYDTISDDYETMQRQGDSLRKRLENAARRVLSRQEQRRPAGSTRRHLDFGCGPGHVLRWLAPLGLQSFGLDVSLQNLRNARRATGAAVVFGDACHMPFADGTMDLVTESSALHHILDWKAALQEAARVCAPDGGVVIDSEPTQAQMAWGPLAIAVFQARFPVYKLLSYVWREKYIYRDLEKARLNLLAEIHHQPGTGFPLGVLERLLADAGFDVDIITSPTADLRSVAQPSVQGLILNLLSARNPWNPAYGQFIAVAVRKN